MTSNRTSQVANKMLTYIEDNDVITWHNLADKHLREVLVKYQRMEVAIASAIKNHGRYSGMDYALVENDDFANLESALAFDPLA